MPHRLLLRIVVLAGIVASCFASSTLATEPRNYETMTARLVVVLLETQSLAKWRVDDALGKKLLAEYIARLDPHKLYFLDSDWREFQKRESSLDDQLKAGDLSFVKLVGERLKTRTAEAHELTQRALQAKHDFTLDETWPFPFDGFAADRAQLAERWRLRIKGETLFERANNASLPEATRFLQGRYESAQGQLKAFGIDVLQGLYFETLCKICSPHDEYWSEALMETMRGSSLGRLTHSPRLRLTPDGDRVVIRDILPPHNDAKTLREIYGWHLIAVHAEPNKVCHMVGIQYYDPQRTSVWQQLRDATDVTLELQHPKTMQRKTITWPLVPINPYRW